MNKMSMLLLACAVMGQVDARTIKGKIRDARTGEEIIGAKVMIKEEPRKVAVSGLDGSFNIATDKSKVTLVCSYLGYKTIHIDVHDNDIVDIPMEDAAVALDGVVVNGSNNGHSEASARLMEMNAVGVMNVMGQQAIELSPDLTVANIIQRMSGVTMERSSSGEGQYAILRGMDKRYNYTLVNGVKIPSPDNKNRFVPLDIFPSELLDRLEVTKALTADMEGDGVGGAVNMVMKDAPSSRRLNVNVATGYNSHFLDRDFQSFAYGDIVKDSPHQRYGDGYPVDATDFVTRNLKVTEKNALPDLVAGVSYGDRFFGERLGMMAAISYSNRNKGKWSDIYDETAGSDGVQDITNREFSENQQRLGAHLKLDFRLASRHKLSAYGGYMLFNNAQVRDAVGPTSQVVRLRRQSQRIASAMLKGEHAFLRSGAFTMNWTLNMAGAENDTPDNAQIQLVSNRGSESFWVNKNVGLIRRWENNTDDDLSAHLNLGYRLDLLGGRMDFSVGGMYRDKQRTSLYHEYSFQPYDEQKTMVQRYDQWRGEDWDNYDEINFRLAGYTISDPLNYDATEKIWAGYGQLRYTKDKWQLTVGLRAEHTRQGYTLKYPLENTNGSGVQDYTDLLPDVHLKYSVHKNANLRLSYYRALNRPSFFEIVPYHVINEDYNECGNPELKHTTADNFDLRYEFFPRASEQLMVCLFYKRINDPIEYGMMPIGQETFYMPGNYGDATNWGVEVDVMKYFNWFGVKANYTYTHSAITTSKLHELTDASGSIYTEYTDQTRPLFGQAAHVFNCSLLFKDAKRGWDGQLAFSYTGQRLAVIDRFYENDRWDAELIQLDTSIEKRFECGLSFFLKANNLLNTPLLRYYHANDRNASVENVRRYNGGVVEREEKTGTSLLLGARLNL